jgi:hypothetical protein
MITMQLVQGPKLRELWGAAPDLQHVDWKAILEQLEFDDQLVRDVNENVTVEAQLIDPDCHRLVIKVADEMVCIVRRYDRYYQLSFDGQLVDGCFEAVLAATLTYLRRFFR